MASRDDIKWAIQSVVRTLMEGVLDKVLRTDPFLADKHRAEKPIYAALVPDEIFKGSHFERRFVTPFGRVWERIAAAVAAQAIGNAEIGRRIYGNVRAERMRRIQEILNRLEHGRQGDSGQRIRPNWEEELAYVLDGGGEQIPSEVISDVFAWTDDGSRKLAFEIKAPMPNSDQTKVSKEKILKLYAMEPPQVTAAYYALPYNPYGRERAAYAWSIPGRWFDMHSDPVVLIGHEFWDTLGGEGTYDAFVEAVNELGEDYRERIYREYLGIEPPEGSGGGFRVKEGGSPYVP